MITDRRICLQCKNENNCTEPSFNDIIVMGCLYFELDESKTDICTLVTIDDEGNKCTIIQEPKTQEDINFELKLELERMKKALDELLLGGGL